MQGKTWSCGGAELGAMAWFGTFNRLETLARFGTLGSPMLPLSRWKSPSCAPLSPAQHDRWLQFIWCNSDRSWEALPRSWTDRFGSSRLRRRALSDGVDAPQRFCQVDFWTASDGVGPKIHAATADALSHSSVVEVRKCRMVFREIS